MQHDRGGAAAARSRRAGRRSSTPLGSFGVGLQRRADHLAVEVDDRVEHRRRACCPACRASAARRVGRRRAWRRDRGRGEEVRRRRARLHRRRRRRTPSTRLLGAAAEVGAEHRVAGEGDDHELRAGDQRGDALRRSRSACAGPGRRRGSASARSAARPAAAGGGEASGQLRAAGIRLAVERGARVERVEVAGRQGVQRGERFGQPRRRRRPRAATGTASPRRWCRRTALRRSPLRRLRRSARRAGHVRDQALRRAACRRSSGSGSPRSAERTAAGSSARSAGFRSPACRIVEQARLASAAAWRWPEPS